MFAVNSPLIYVIPWWQGWTNQVRERELCHQAFRSMGDWANAQADINGNGRSNLLSIHGNQCFYLLPTRPSVATLHSCYEFRIWFDGHLVYAALGMSGPKVLMITGINGALGVIVTGFFITFVLDRVGRRPPLIFGELRLSLQSKITVYICNEIGTDIWYVIRCYWDGHFSIHWGRYQC